MKAADTKKTETKTIKEEATMKTTTTQSHNVGKANPAVIADIRTRVEAGTVTGNTYHTLKECKRSIPKINTIMWQNLDLIIEKLPSMTDDEIADLINNGGENPTITNVEAEPILITEISSEAKAKADAEKTDAPAESYGPQQLIADLENLAATATDESVKVAVANAIPEIKNILAADTKDTVKVVAGESVTTDTAEQTDEPSVAEQSVEPDPVLITEISTEAKSSKANDEPATISEIHTEAQAEKKVDNTAAEQIIADSEAVVTKITTKANTKPKADEQFIKRSEIPPFSDELLRKLRDRVKTVKDHTLVRTVCAYNWERLYPEFKHLLA